MADETREKTFTEGSDPEYKSVDSCQASDADFLVAPDPRDVRKAGPGILELIYGILFDPVGTYGRIAENPPMGRVVAIFLTVNLLSISVLLAGWMFFGQLPPGELPGTADRLAGQILRIAAPAAAVLGLIYAFVKWFAYSGILFLLAGLLGGGGSAAGVLAATGLASLPVMLFLPFQILALILAGGGPVSTLMNIVVWIAVMIWGAVLVVIGLKQTQQLSTGRAVLAALIPPAAIAAFLILFLIIFAAVFIPMGLFIQQPDDINF